MAAFKLANYFVLQALVQAFSGAVSRRLNQGFALLPLTRDLLQQLDALGLIQNGEEPEIFSKKGESWLQEQMKGVRLAYVAAEFFGGAGGHAGIIWEQNQRVFTGSLTPSTMNEVLRRLGVEALAGQDEFDTLGLGLYRSTEDWLVPPM